MTEYRQVRAGEAAGSGPAEPHVAILMGTCNGERFIGEQLASIGRQTHKNWSLWISDDGSSDRTPEAIRAFAALHGAGRVHLLAGPRKGFARNFLSLACNDHIHADYYAFCDQDDIWFEPKLEVALAALRTSHGDLPSVYFGRTRSIDVEGREGAMSPLFSRPPGLKNALVQSIGGGNTTVFNTAARRLLRLAGADLDIPSHDWWTYLAVSACGGRVVYDPVPQVGYRQHGGNLVGENSSLAARISRLNLLLEGRFSRWLDQNLEALRRLGSSVTTANRMVIEHFGLARAERLPWRRLANLRRLGLYRQTLLGTLSLYAAAALNKW